MRASRATSATAPEAVSWDRTAQGVSWDSSAVGPELRALLAEAAAPGRPEELSGLPAASAAFARHHARRRTTVTSVLAKLVAAKLAAATAGSVALSGIALAAAAGALPPALQDAAHSAIGAPAAGTDDTSGTTAAPTDTATTGDGTTSGTAADGAPTAAPTPNLAGLCHAFSAGVATSAGKALANPAFTVLLTAAGATAATDGSSADGAGQAARVAAYCSTLPGVAPTGPPATHRPPAHQPNTHRPSTHRPVHVPPTTSHRPATHAGTGPTATHATATQPSASAPAALTSGVKSHTQK